MSVNWPWLLGLLALPGLFALMVLWITWQNWRTSGWQNAVGRIVESRSTARDVRTRESHLTGRSDHNRGTLVTTERIDRKNFADIAYQYTVDGKTYVSRQVGIGPDHGNLDVVALLQRYPAGKVVTVFYDPASPGNAILERDDPRRLREAWLAIAILAAVIVIGFLAFYLVADFIAAHAVNPRRTVPIMFVLVAAVLLALMAWAAIRRAATMRAWPATDGVVASSRVEQTIMHRRRSGSQYSTTATVYVPRVIYHYRVGGIDIDGDQFGRMSSGTAAAVAERVVAAFPAGTKVVVHYDPNEPTTAIVDPAAGRLPLVLAGIALVLFAVAGALAVL